MPLKKRILFRKHIGLHLIRDFISSRINDAYGSYNPSKPIETKSKRLRILVLESDLDTRTVYARYFKGLPIELVTTEGGKECLEQTIMPESVNSSISDDDITDNNSSNYEDYDLIIIDVNLKYSLDTDGKKKYPILQKSFRFSELRAMIKPAKFKTTVKG